MPSREEAFGVPALDAAEEVFLSASLRGVRAVCELPSGRTLAAPGPLTHRLGCLYQEEALRAEA